MAWVLNTEYYVQRSMGGEKSRDRRCMVLIVLSAECQQKPNDGLGDKIMYSHKLPTILPNKA